MKRPGGITFLAALAIVSGILGLMLACVSLGLGSIATPLGRLFGGTREIGINAVYAGLGALVGAAFWIATGVGALNLKPWAWIVGLVAAGISILSAIWGLIAHGAGWLCVTLPSVVLPVGILIYLLTPAVRRAFGRR